MTTAKNILIVEDEKDLADLLAYNLQRAGYQTTVASDGKAALDSVFATRPDAIVLDRMLPFLSGLDVARRVRTDPRTATVPILMLTARVTEADQVAGLEVGADDYVTKPFSTKVLLARIEALLRRSERNGSAVEQVVFGPIELDLSTQRVLVEGEPVPFTTTEFRLLAALVRAQGKALSRFDLMSIAMGPDVAVTTRTIDVHVAAIRKKLGRHGDLIGTIRGVGYRMTEDPDDPVGRPLQ